MSRASDEALLVAFCGWWWDESAKFEEWRDEYRPSDSDVVRFLASRESPATEPEPLPSLQEMCGEAARLVPMVREFLETEDAPPATFPGCPKCGAIAIDYDPKDCGCTAAIPAALPTDVTVPKRIK